jgi:hypothetical protein
MDEKGKGGSAKRHHIRKQVIAEARRANLKADLGKVSYFQRKKFV